MVILAIAIAFGCSIAISTESTIHSLRWQMESCGTLEDVTDFLNKLPPERAIEAKVTTINSQRSFMGALSDPYKVWYRK
jgi:hypothetical protein